MESDSRYIEVRPRPDQRNIELTFYSESISEPFVKKIDPPTTMVGETTIAAEFFYLRGSPVLFGLSCDASGTVNYKYAVSIGGTEVATGNFGGAPVIKPTKIRFGNKSQDGNAPMLHFGGKDDEQNPDSESALASTLRSLAMLFRRLETAGPPEDED